MTNKKSGSAGRFGSRYGLKIRKRVVAIEKLQKTKQKCPYCSKLSIKRISSGIYRCKTCKKKMTGKAYTI